VELTRLYPGGGRVSAEEVLGDLRLGDLAPPGRPYVVVNFVSSLDGHATLAGKSAPLSSEADRRIFHLLRAQVDAVFAGTQTLRLERYGRVVRDPQLRELRVANGLSADPLALVVSRSGDVPWEIPMFAAAEQAVAVFTGAEAGTPEVAAELRVTRVSADAALPEAFALARSEHGVRSVLCEGGPHVFGALLAAGLVDELFLTAAPLLAGGGSALGITAGPELTEPAQLELVSALESESALFLRYHVTSGP
jgi:riboflavin biosynthesis pyrimidine reductase